MEQDPYLAEDMERKPHLQLDAAKSFATWTSSHLEVLERALAQVPPEAHDRAWMLVELERVEVRLAAYLRRLRG